ncbi:hypothetical protein K438DRAFT_1554043, partial [Mycena galopus ATCC 62051]
SPFRSIITQEIMPDASEMSAIREFVQNTNAQIALREHTIDRLRCEVVELRHRSEHHEAILAPIRRVPREIMAEIFLQLAAIKTRRRRNQPAPLIFGEISREWRAVALSIPNLWK